MPISGPCAHGFGDEHRDIAAITAFFGLSTAASLCKRTANRVLPDGGGTAGETPGLIATSAYWISAGYFA